MSRLLVACAGVLLAASLVPAQSTLASWADNEHGSAAFTAGSVSPPTALHCSGGIAAGITFSWTPPVGGVTRVNYAWALSGGLTDSGTVGAAATSVTIPSSALTVLATAAFSVRATGPGGWTSSALTGTVTVALGLFGVNVATCTPP